MAYQLKSLGFGHKLDYARGLFLTEAYDVRDNLVVMAANFLSGFERVGPEGELEYAVDATKLRPNSDVSSVTAKLSVQKIPDENPPVAADVVVDGPDGRGSYGLESSGGAVA